jgi:hypothetical protein
MGDEKQIDLKIDALRETLAAAASVYSAEEVREIVSVVLTGGNYRTLTEKATREELSVYQSWMMYCVHAAASECGADWVKRLLGQCARRSAMPEERWLRLWLLGLTEKTRQNLGIKLAELAEQLPGILDSNADAVSKLTWQPTSIELTSDDPARPSVALSPADSVWLLQVAGAATLTIRGSRKSTIGKRLEKAITRAALTLLGLHEGTNFKLNIQRDAELEREVDALIYTKHGSIKMDIALIGTGNQEVTEDKLARVGANGIVLVDKLGEKSNVRKNAAGRKVKLIQIRNNFPLSDIHDHLRALIPDEVTLLEPPTSDKELIGLVSQLPASAFELPKLDKDQAAPQAPAA